MFRDELHLGWDGRIARWNTSCSISAIRSLGIEEEVKDGVNIRIVAE
jgi:hypothetical protein